MDAPRKRDSIIAVAAIGVAVLWIAYQSGLLLAAGKESPAQGVVSSVSGPVNEKEARVQLDDGVEVRAVVPPQCIVFPGYIVTVGHNSHFFGVGPRYRIITATEKK